MRRQQPEVKAVVCICTVQVIMVFIIVELRQYRSQTPQTLPMTDADSRSDSPIELKAVLMNRICVSAVDESILCRRLLSWPLRRQQLKDRESLRL